MRASNRLSFLVLAWWESHQDDRDGEGELVYEVEPPMVSAAKEILWEEDDVE